MNDTPQGDGNFVLILILLTFSIRMNDTPQGDGNLENTSIKSIFSSIRMNDTPQGDGNFNFFLI